MSDEAGLRRQQKVVSSSNHGPGEFNAVVLHHEQVTGPVRLPLEDAERFVREFNARYEKLGIRVRATEKSSLVAPLDAPLVDAQ